MEWSSGNFSRTPKIHSIADSSCYPLRLGEIPHRTGRISDRMIFVSMFNDKKGNEDSCTLTSTYRQYDSRFVKERWAFIGPRSEDKWFQEYDYKPDGKWDSIASTMVK